MTTPPAAIKTGSINVTRYFDELGEYHPCRCGVDHRGDYAVEDWIAHNCFHDEPLLLTADKELLICSQCGQTFGLEEENSI